MMQAHHRDQRIVRALERRACLHLTTNGSQEVLVDGGRVNRMSAMARVGADGSRWRQVGSGLSIDRRGSVPTRLSEAVGSCG